MTKIKWFSIIRVLGLLLVFVYHFFQTSLPGGFLGVDMFFTLSGYLIAALAIDAFLKTGEFRFFAFIKRRITRTLPPLICAALIVLPFTLLISPDFTAGVVRQVAASIGFVTNIFEILTGGSYENRMLPHLFQHTWTLAVEMHYYLFWGLLLAAFAFLINRRTLSTPEKSAAILKRIVFALSAVLALLAYFRMQIVYERNIIEPSAAYFGTLTHGFPFLLGAAAGALFGFDNKKANRYSAKASATLSVLAITLSAGGIVLLAATLDFYSEIVYRFGFLCTSLLTIVIIRCALILNGAAEGVREPRPLIAVTSLSYSLYLFHWPLYIVFANVIGSNVLAAAAALALSFAFSALVVYVIEPSINEAAALKTAAKFTRERRRPTSRAMYRLAVSPLLLAAVILSGVVLARAPEISSLEADLNAGYLYMDADAIGEPYYLSGAINDEPILIVPDFHPAETTLPDEPDTAANTASVSVYPVAASAQPTPDTTDSMAAPVETEPPAAVTAGSAPESPSPADASPPAGSVQESPASVSATPASPQESTAPVSAPPASPQESPSPADAPLTSPQESPAPAASLSDAAQERNSDILEGVTIIGDSVCMGARRNLIDVIPNCFVDAEGSRQIWQGYDLLMSLQREDRLREYIVVALGTNGNRNAPDKIEQIIADIRPGHRLIFVTPYDGRATPSWSSYRTAEYMRTLPERYPFVTVADWAETITPHAHLLGSDKVHIGGQPTAIDLYTNCIVDALNVAAGKPAKQ